MAEIKALADYVLEVINQYFAEAGVDLPDRQVVLTGGQGSAVHEAKEQLTISLEQIYSGAPGDQASEPSKCTGPMSAVFGVELVRCIPTVQEGRSTRVSPVSQEELTKSAYAQMQDAHLLMQAGLAAAQGTWMQGGLADVTAGPPSGGVQAMVLSLVMVIGDTFD